MFYLFSLKAKNAIVCIGKFDLRNLILEVVLCQNYLNTLGLLLSSFPKNEYEPIHVHAFYGDNCQIKVSFRIVEGVIEETIYEIVKGYDTFPPAQMQDLQTLINKYQYTIVNTWVKYFILNEKIQTIYITKRIK